MRDIPGYPGYKVDEDGSLWRMPTPHRRNPRKITGGSTCPLGRKYKLHQLFVDGRRVFALHHHLVALAFYGPRPDGMVIDHIDGNSTNNHPANLRYCSRSENARNPSNKILKFTREQIVQAKARLAAGEPVASVAKSYGGSYCHAYALKQGRLWAYL